MNILLNLFKYLELLEELVYLYLNKVTSKYMEKNFLIVLYTLSMMLESLFSHLFVVVFLFFIVSDKFLHSLNRFVLKESCLCSAVFL